MEDSYQSLAQEIISNGTANPAREAVIGEKESVIPNEGDSEEYVNKQSESEEVEGEVESEGEESEDDSSESSDEFKLIHNGEELTATRDETVKLAQMGLDYTKKTQALAQDKKNFMQEVQMQQEELQAKQAQLQQVEDEYQHLDFFISNLQQTDPELFSQFAQKFQQSKAQNENPMIKEFMRKQEEKFNQLAKPLMEKDVMSLKQQLDSEIAQAKEGTGKEYEDLGIMLDWEAIRQGWADSNDSIEQVIDRLYGSKYRQMSKTKKSLASEQKKAQAIKETRPMVKKVEQKQSKDYDGRNGYAELANDLLKEFRGA